MEMRNDHFQSEPVTDIRRKSLEQHKQERLQEEPYKSLDRFRNFLEIMRDKDATLAAIDKEASTDVINIADKRVFDDLSRILKACIDNLGDVAKLIMITGDLKQFEERLKETRNKIDDELTQCQSILRNEQTLQPERKSITELKRNLENRKHYFDWIALKFTGLDNHINNFANDYADGEEIEIINLAEALANIKGQMNIDEVLEVNKIENEKESLAEAA